MASPAMAVVTTADTQPQQSQINVEGEIDVDPSDLPGDGSESTPYEISNVSELQAMEDDLGANYTLVSDMNAPDTAQFNNGSGFDPVGGSGLGKNTPPPFTGTFDGNNNTITGLTINRPNENSVGLFGVTGSDATLTNVALANVTVTGGEGQVGGLVGENRDRGTITDATISGSVTGESEVGGLVGENRDRGTITNATASVSVTGRANVGGLVGLNVDQGKVQSTAVSGSVTASEGDAGGLIGDNSGIIRNATASGSVTTAGEFGEVGGLVGGNLGTITNTRASGRWVDSSDSTLEAGRSTTR
jgi:hypothetical protein